MAEQQARANKPVSSTCETLEAGGIKLKLGKRCPWAFVFDHSNIILIMSSINKAISQAMCLFLHKYTEPKGKCLTMQKQADIWGKSSF